MSEPDYFKCATCGADFWCHPVPRDASGAAICRPCVRSACGDKCVDCARDFDVREYPLTAFDVYLIEARPRDALCLGCMAVGALAARVSASDLNADDVEHQREYEQHTREYERKRDDFKLAHHSSGLGAV